MAVKQLKATNFKSKKERKRVRKTLRAQVSNKIADVKLESAARVQFYRTLREKKLRRREIAQGMQLLAELVGDLHSTVRRQTSRNACDVELETQARELSSIAKGKAQAVADDYHRLARQSIFYSEGGMAA